jgi:hypothetical protein
MRAIGLNRLIGMFRRTTDREALSRDKPPQGDVAHEAPPSSAANSSIYDNPSLRWSGHVGKPLPLKTLTFRQFDCLDDARQGFMILADLPSGTSGKTGDRLRYHAPRTVESLHKHGFLAEISSNQDAFRITDHGLHAVEACTVRY